MDKMKIALNSTLLSFAYMMIALLVVFAAMFLDDVLNWPAVFAFVVGSCLILASIDYSGRVYGFGFVQEDYDDE